MQKDRPIRAAWLLHLQSGMSAGKAIARTVSIVALGVAVTLGASCMRVPASIQKLTVPPNFYYIPEERIHSSMWMLAAEVQRLDELLRTAPDSANLAAQRAIQSGLRRMAVAVEQIDHPGRTTQHSALNLHLSRFAQRIANAQRGADRNPPNYFYASTLSGSCFLCHGSVDDAESP